MDHKAFNSVSEEEALGRAKTFSYLISLVYLVYGFVSYDFIQRFDAEASLFNNIWPRVLFNSLPMLIIPTVLSRLKVSNYKKLVIWSVTFFLTFHIGAWIYVWPLALHGHAEIINYVSAANIYLICLSYAFVSPPKSVIKYFTFSLVVLFLIPLWAVCIFSGDGVTSNLVISDSIIAAISGHLISINFHRLRSKIFSLEQEKANEAAKFLGPQISKAIFEGESEILKEKLTNCYVVSIDIRGSTQLAKKHGKAWLDFRLKYFAMVGSITSECGGYIQKTMGDSHVINWGIMDNNTYLDDIDGLENDLKAYEDKRLQRASSMVFKAIDKIADEFSKLTASSFPFEPIQLGIGVDKGLVLRAVQGSNTVKELDFNGDPVNCSSRLQEYSKVHFKTDVDALVIVVISPFACDYLSELAQFTRFNCETNMVRDYESIKWVLLKKYKARGLAYLKRSA